MTDERSVCGVCRKELTHECGACRLIQPMLDELKALTAARAGHNAAMNVGAGVLGSRILQILEVTSAVVVPPPPKKSIFSRAVSSPNLAHSASGTFAWPTVRWLCDRFSKTMAGRCLQQHFGLKSCGCWILLEGGKQNVKQQPLATQYYIKRGLMFCSQCFTRMNLQEEAEKKPTEVEPADMAFMEELADRTERLWGALSATIAAVEADVARSQTSAPEGAAPGSRMLPPGVLQVGASAQLLLSQPTVAPQHFALVVQGFPW